MKLAIRQLSLRLQGFTLDIEVDLQHARTAIFGPSGAGKHRSWKPLPGCADQTLQTSHSMINYSTTAGKIIRCQFASGGWVMFRNTIRCFPICQSSAISFSDATASQKITRLSSTISSSFWTSDIYSIVMSVRFRVVRINVS